MGVLRHFEQYFSYIVTVSFIGEGNRSTQRKQPTCRKSLTNFITYCGGEYISPWAGFELTTLVVIDTDCICSCKSSYHTTRTTTMTAPTMSKQHTFTILGKNREYVYFYDIMFLLWFVLSNVYFSVQCFVDHSLSFFPFSLGHCIVCLSSIDGFWLHL